MIESENDELCSAPFLFRERSLQSSGIRTVSNQLLHGRSFEIHREVFRVGRVGWRLFIGGSENFLVYLESEKLPEYETAHDSTGISYTNNYFDI